LTTRSRYGFLFDFKPTDYKKWARGLSKAGYATDKRYPQKLIALIEKYGLDKYDRSTQDDRTVRIVSSGQGDKDLVHTVRYGDTLYSISKRYSKTVEELKRINKMNDSNLAVGQKLIIE